MNVRAASPTASAFLTESLSSSPSSSSCSRSFQITPLSVTSVNIVNPFLLRFRNPTIASVTSKSCSQAFVISHNSKFFCPRFRLYSSNLDSNFLDGDRDDDNDDEKSEILTVDDDDYDPDRGLDSDSVSADGMHIEIEKLGRNSRRIYARIGIDVPLLTLWNILTDYERLADFIPGLAVSQLLHKTDNYARLLQVGQQNLPFGLKFNAKGIVDCYEKELERLPFSQKRDIEFKMVEGDFQIFEGRWSIEEFKEGRFQDGNTRTLQDQETYTTLSYMVNVKPKLWLPVRLVESRLCNEIKMNLICIREEAYRVSHETLRTL